MRNPGRTHPAADAAPLQGGDKKIPLLGGVAEGRGGFLSASHAR